MTSKKAGSNPFAPSQEAKQSSRCTRIGASLTVLMKGRARFDCVTHLARLVATQISQLEGKPISPSTLLRNSRYRPLVQEAYDRGLKSDTSDAIDVPKVVDVTGFRQLQIENSNLKAENARMKVRLSAFESSRSPLSEQGGGSSSSEQARPYEEEFVLTCQALERIIKKSAGLLDVDAQGNIIDGSKKVNNVIAEARLAQPFNNWRDGIRRG